MSGAIEPIAITGYAAGDDHVQDQDDLRRSGAGPGNGDDLADTQFTAPPPGPSSETIGARPRETGSNDRSLDGDLGDVELARLPTTTTRQPVSGIVASVGAALLMLGLGLYATTRTAESDAIPLLRATDLWFWLGAVMIVLAAAAGAQFAEFSAQAGSDALGQERIASGFPSAWLLPGCAAIAAVALIATYHNIGAAVAGTLLTLISTLVALVARDLFEELTDSAVRVAALIHGIAIHLVAFVALAMLYMNKLPEWLTAGLVGLISGALVLESLRRVGRVNGQRLGLAALGGLVMAQSAVAIEWWPTWGWTGGTALLVGFFLVNGLVVTWAVQGGIGRRDVGYYASLGSIGLVLIAVIGLR